MKSESSVQYQYSIFVDILAEMVTNYLTTKEKKESNDKKRGDGNIER